MSWLFRRYDTSSAYLEAENRLNDLLSDDSVELPIDTSVLLDMAKDKWQHVNDAKDAIEKKAAAVIVFTTAAVAALPSTTPQINLLGIGCGLLAIALAISVFVLLPSDWPQPMSILDAIDHCHKKSADRQKAQLSASMNCAIVGGLVVLSRKSVCLQWGYVVASVGAIVLVFSRVFGLMAN